LLEPSLKGLVFLFDLLVLNTDRTVENPNIVLTDAKPYFLDFSVAFEVRGAIVHRQFNEITLLPVLREHPFYNTDISVQAFSSSRQALEQIIASVPYDWLPNQTDKQKVEHLEKLLEGSPEILQRRLSILRELPEPNYEAKKLRALESREGGLFPCVDIG
jgi:hypothetical protein